MFLNCKLKLTIQPNEREKYELRRWFCNRNAERKSSGLFKNGEEIW